MGYQAFDQYASEYDAWFKEDRNVLETELRLVASTLRKAGRILSIGSGSGLFEKLLKDRYSIEVARCIEPAEGMAAIARKRGFEVEINTADRHLPLIHVTHIQQSRTRCRVTTEAPMWQ